jgi:tRNA U34 5-methylaminomethyl-2-thiouridine-forming methyltransferase MnmC
MKPKRVPATRGKRRKAREVWLELLEAAEGLSYAVSRHFPDNYDAALRLAEARRHLDTVAAKVREALPSRKRQVKRG